MTSINDFIAEFADTAHLAEAQAAHDASVQRVAKTRESLAAATADHAAAERAAQQAARTGDADLMPHEEKVELMTMRLRAAKRAQDGAQSAHQEKTAALAEARRQAHSPAIREAMKRRFAAVEAADAATAALKDAAEAFKAADRMAAAAFAASGIQSHASLGSALLDAHGVPVTTATQQRAFWSANRVVDLESFRFDWMSR
jgi:exonuclease VII large subunit